MSDAVVLLVGHGARRASWAAPLERLAVELRGYGVRVQLAYLEFMQPGVPAALESLCRDGARSIRVVPVFLGAGGHVLEDLAACVEQARAQRRGVSIRLEPAIGEMPQVLTAIAGAIAG
jgi:sirohydrochlorin cobaltochelatase